MNQELDARLPGITWNFSQNIRDNVMEALSGIKGDNSVKIIGPDLDRLELLAAKTKAVLREIRGIDDSKDLVPLHPIAQVDLEALYPPATGRQHRYGARRIGLDDAGRSDTPALQPAGRRHHGQALAQGGVLRNEDALALAHHCRGLRAAATMSAEQAESVRDQQQHEEHSETYAAPEKSARAGSGGVIVGVVRFVLVGCHDDHRQKRVSVTLHL